jgi:hypothetical protein
MNKILNKMKRRFACMIGSIFNDLCAYAQEKGKSNRVAKRKTKGAAQAPPGVGGISKRRVIMKKRARTLLL